MGILQYNQVVASPVSWGKMFYSVKIYLILPEWRGILLRQSSLVAKCSQLWKHCYTELCYDDCSVVIFFPPHQMSVDAKPAHWHVTLLQAFLGMKIIDYTYSCVFAKEKDQKKDRIPENINIV